MMPQDGALLDQPIGCQVVRIEVSSVPCQDSFSAILREVARVDRQVLNEQLLDGLGAVVCVTIATRTLSSDLDQLGLAVQARCEEQVLTGMETHRANNTLVLACSIRISQLAVR